MTGKFVVRCMLLASVSCSAASFAQVAQQEGVTGGDILVTAQRRAESLQKVPITMTAVSAAALEASGVANTVDLPSVTPGLSMTATRNGVTPYLRGVGTQSSTSEQAVAVYIDNIYIASTAATMFQLNNVERIEVLKGPQGTLFGRNATGGLINVITRDPSYDLDVRLSAGYGNYDTWTGSVYATTGLTNNVAVDFAGYFNRQGNGWGKNLFLGNDVNLSRGYSLRSKLKIDLGASTDVIFSGDYSHNQTDFGNARQVRRGTIAAGGITTIGSIYDTNSDVPSGIGPATKQWGVSMKVNHNFSDAISLTSTTAYRDNNYPSFTDSDDTPVRGVAGQFVEVSNSFQQELLLNGDFNRLQLTAGAFYYHYVRGEQPLVVYSVVPARQSYRWTEVTTNSYSVFGQGTYALTDRTNFTAGLRYTTEKSHAKGQIRAGTLSTDPITFDTATRTDGISNTDKASKLTWRLSLDHNLTDDVMIYASYNRGFKSGSFNPFAINDEPTRPETLDAYEIGFKSNLFGNIIRLNGAAFYYDYKDIQVSTILTVGTGDRNAANGRIKGGELELVVAPPVSTGHFEIRGSMTVLDTQYKNYMNALANVPNVNIGGVDYTGPALCNRAASGQSLSGTMTGGNTTCELDASGRDMAKAPSFTSSVSADYTIPISDNLQIGFNGTWMYMGKFNWDPYGLFPNASYHTINGQLSIGARDDRWRVRLWGRNMTDTAYYSQVGPSGSGAGSAAGAPRTYGIAFDLQFGK